VTNRNEDKPTVEPPSPQEDGESGRIQEVGGGLVFHYTDEVGYKAISSQVEWYFKASSPPGRHPRGAFFTVVSPDSPKLAKSLRIPRRKLEYLFCFADAGDLRPIDGDRGIRGYSLYHPDDYVVARKRQVFHGRTADFSPELK
jgi:hypothetical protein